MSRDHEFFVSWHDVKPDPALRRTKAPAQSLVSIEDVGVVICLLVHDVVRPSWARIFTLMGVPHHRKFICPGLGTQEGEPMAVDPRQSSALFVRRAKLRLH